MLTSKYRANCRIKQNSEEVEICRKVLALVSVLLQIMKYNLISGDYTIRIGDSKYTNEK